MKKILRPTLLMTFSLALCSYAQSATLEISCSGNATASLSGNAPESEVLNPWFYPFTVDLQPYQALFIGALYGGCGQFGCPSHLESTYRVFMDNNEKIYREKVNELGDTIEIFPGTNVFHVNRYNYLELALECSLEIKR